MHENGVIQNILCMSCLCVGRSLKRLNETLKKYYIGALNEIPLFRLECMEPTVCWDCETILYKCLAFREQLKDSYRILQTYSDESLQECLLSDVSRPPRLKVHVNDPITIHPDIMPSSEIKIELDEAVPKSGDGDCLKSDSDAEVHSEEIQSFSCDIKTEYEFPEDYDNGSCGGGGDAGCLLVPMNEEIKLETKNDTGYVENEPSKKMSKKSKLRKQKKCDRVKRHKNRKRRTEKEGAKKKKRIITIVLSHEEMMAERLALAQAPEFACAEHKCESCLVTFTKASTYNAHVKSRHDPNIGNYTCPICETVVSSVVSFSSHYKRHLRRYECTVCQKRSTDATTVHRHYQNAHVTDVTLHVCDVCGHVSRSADQYRYHRDTHKRRVQCTDCLKTFTHRSGLVNHRISVHEAQNEFPCKLCKKIFRWETSLKRHLEKHATDNHNPDAFCAPCGIAFSSVSSLQRHLRNSLKHVTPEQHKFICDHCKRRFADKTKLRAHIEEKHLHFTYQCYICLKPSKNRTALEQHVRNVHKGRPNNKMCHQCGKSFPTKMQLESHLRMHSGERPFICEYCPTTFSQPSNLYKHHRQVHQSIRMNRKKLALKRNDITSGPAGAGMPMDIQYMAAPQHEFAV